jgi:DNA-binding winged helix-turn-helix (wHTH) protein/TolB-like protein/tetratricopeptide (TPR) repeat protein
MPEQVQRIYEFDNFRLDVRNRELLRDGAPVTLPGKAFDMLVVLIENGGRLVEKDELFSRIWPDQIVEESNLTVQVSAIRKALGERKENPHYIVTVPGHGYRFIGNLTNVNEEEEMTVIERHSISRLRVENENVPSDNNRLAAVNPIGQIPAIIAPGSQINSSGRRRASMWGVAFLAVLALTVAGLGLVFALKRLRPPAETVSAFPIKSIAVLPFKPLDAGNRDQSLELGMADALITRFSGLKEIMVRPTSAVRKYNGLEQDAIAAGREQQVDAVLDGSLQRSGDRLRVTVRFLRVADGQVLWTDHFDDKFTDIFAVQDRVSAKIVGLLAVRLTEQEQKVLTKRNTDSPQAYELYLKGNHSSGTEEKLRTNIEFFQRAIKLDPGYARAYAGLADSYMKLGGPHGYYAPRETFPQAKGALLKALEIDEALAEGHELLGTYKLFYEWDWAGAEQELKRAIQLDPNNGAAHEWYGVYLQSRGRFDESLVEKKLAQKFDPINPNIIADVGYTFFFARRYDAAMEQYRKALELNPNYAWCYVALAEAHLREGTYGEAIAEINKSLSLDGDNRTIAILGYAYALAGRHDEARKVLSQLEELSKRKYVPAFFIAIIYVGLEDKDEAFDWLEKAFQERNPNLVNLKVQPIFDQIRSDPRFVNLLQRIGL